MGAVSVVDSLNRPVPAALLEWRVGRKIQNNTRGVMFPYVSARAIQARLDEVFGVTGWYPEYRTISTKSQDGFICRLTCTDPSDGTAIIKEDGAGCSDMEAVKGGISSALKRTASVLGIGRYLYELDAVIVDLDNGYFKGEIMLPDKFLPECEASGRNKIEVVYKNKGNHAATSQSKAMTDEVKAAMNVVVSAGKYNVGKKMGEISLQSLKFIAQSGSTTEEKNAAAVVLAYKS